MSTTQQEQYIASVKEFIAPQNAYEFERNKLFIKHSEILLQMKFTYDEYELQSLHEQLDNNLKALEELGIGPEDKTFENTNYYFDKYDQALKKYAEEGYGGRVNDIHTDDVSLPIKLEYYFHAFQVHLGTLYLVLLGILHTVLEYLM